MKLAYLDLLESCLLGTIYRDPPCDPWRGILRNSKGEIVKLGEAEGALTVEPGRYDAEARHLGRDWPATAHTMIGRVRLRQLRSAIVNVLAGNVPGDLIETGVWRGGACIYMRGILKAFEIPDRRVFVADSFTGLPAPEGDVDRGDWHHINRLLAVSRAEVEANFDAYDLLDDQVVFLEGLFKDTLPTAPIEKLAVLRIDGDMYGSTMDALVNLYDKLSPGGFCIVDDYGAVPGCRRATDDFRLLHNATESIENIDGVGIYWIKL